MLREFIDTMREWYSNDYIEMKHGYIRPFSLLWWIIRTAQSLGVVAGLWIWYVVMWAVLA